MFVDGRREARVGIEDKRLEISDCENTRCEQDEILETVEYYGQEDIN